MSNYIKVDIKTNSAEQIEILIAELSEMKFYAFEEDKNILKAYMFDEDFDEASLKIILLNRMISYTVSVLPKENWNKQWEDEFVPVIIDSFAAIRAAFHPPVKSVMHEIIITPKMSFGTGHHPTTYLMIKEMQKIDFKNKNVLDFGTGTGVLSILAEKLGANKIISIDIDDWSIENALENIKVNHSQNINVLKSNAIAELGIFDIILANINLDVIISEVNNLKKICQKKTQLLLSGFLKPDEKMLLKNFLSAGFIYNSVQQKEEWICIRLSL